MRWPVGGVLALVVLGLLAFVLILRLLGPAQLPSPASYPAQSWRSSTPEEQGFDTAPL